MQIVTLFSALALAALAASQNTTASLISICTAQHDACDIAPEANHAFCASQFFGCIGATSACGCLAAEQACITAAGNAGTDLFDCIAPAAACVIGCQNTSSSTTTTTASASSTVSTTTSIVTSLPSGAANTTASLLAICEAQRDSCETAPEANHAFCAAQYFGCLDFGDTCGCQAASQTCLENPPTGDIFDCGPGLAACVVACIAGNSTVTTTASSITASSTASASISPVSTTVLPTSLTTTVITSTTGPIGTGSPVGPTSSGSGSATTTSPPIFSGAAMKNGAGSLAGVLLAGAVMLL